MAYPSYTSYTTSSAASAASALHLRHKRSAINRTSPAADVMSLERLIRDGPPDSDVRGALESARLKVLDQGIRADSDGMVSCSRANIWIYFAFYADEYDFE